MAPRWCSGRDLEESSPILRASPRKMPQPSASGIARPKKSRREIFLPERYAEPLPQTEREALLSRPRSAANSSRSPTASRSMSCANCSRTNTCGCCSCSRCRCSALGWSTRCRRHPDGLGNPRLRSRKWLPALPRRLVQSGARTDGNLHRRRRHYPAAGEHRPDRHRERQARPASNSTDGRTVRARQFVASTLDVHQTFETLVGREQLPAAFLKSSTASSTPPGACSASIWRCNESPRFAAEKFDPNINRSLKWSIGAETMEDLFSAHQDVQAGRVPKLVQFGSGPLSLLDPTQAPPGKHTTYCWHVMPLDPDLGGAKLRKLQGGILRQDRRDASRATART